MLPAPTATLEVAPSRASIAIIPQNLVFCQYARQKIEIKQPPVKNGGFFIMGVKKRNWAFVLYPESAPEDWLEKLQLTGLQIAISPLHDKDLDADNKPKKAHYHVILVYGNPTTYNNVKSLTDSLNQPIPQPLEQVRGYYRYFTHKDNPDKYQYSENEIISINGFNISDFVEMTKSEVLVIKRNLQTLIREEDFLEYSVFLDYVQDNCSTEEYDVASSNTILFNTYIKSRRYGGRPINLDTDTGEIL